MITINPPIRGNDVHGNGAFGAPRGSRTHNGIDMVCARDSIVLSVCNGRVTKVGYPYSTDDPKKGHLRYVQVTDEEGYDVRYFYCLPHNVKIGDDVRKGDAIAITQGLLKVYPGITDHFHFEVKYKGGYENPHHYIELTE